MDIERAIRELYEEKKRIDKAIQVLEELIAQGKAAVPVQRSRRGRKSMPETERREVSQRMKKYWRARRLAKEAQQ